MSDTPKVASARIEVEKRRAALIDTVRELQHRIKPRALASEALDNLAGEVWERAKNRGADLAEDAVDAVRARPLAAGGAVAALTMFLAREPLINLAKRMFSSNKKKPTPDKPATDKPAPDKRRKRAAKPAPASDTEKKS